MMKRLVLLMSVCACFAPAAFADCAISKMPDKPTIPTGNAATYHEMAVARTNVVAFIDQAKIHLDCIASSRKYNYAVGQIYKMASDYNSQLKVFKSRRQVVKS